MSVRTQPTDQAVNSTTTAHRRLARMRRGSLAVIALLTGEYVLGMYVNLYITPPSADRGHSIGTAIANGPAMLSLHAVIGLLLGLGTLGILALSILVRHPGAIVASAAGLFAMVFAAIAGASFTSTGNSADSMAMAVMTGIGLLCYATILTLAVPHRLLTPPARPRP
jgi:hypothetical protein